MTAQAVLQYSEEFNFSDPSAKDFDIDVLQYERADFDFWSDTLVRRSINRFLTDDATHGLKKLHPLDNRTIHLQRALQDNEQDSVIHFPQVFKSRVYGERSVSTLQEWECVIDHVTEDFVTAQGVSLIDRGAEDHMVTIPIAEFAPKDRPHLMPGVIFRLIVGFVKKANGSRGREAICYLRRSSNAARKPDKEIFAGL